MTYCPESDIASATGRRAARERLARSLYETMERLSDEAYGPPWDELEDDAKPWYRDCVEGLLANPHLVKEAIR